MASSFALRVFRALPADTRDKIAHVNDVLHGVNAPDFPSVSTSTQLDKDVPAMLLNGTSQLSRTDGRTETTQLTGAVPRKLGAFFGPVNYSGQAYAWAESLQRNHAIPALCYQHGDNNPLGYSAHYFVNWRTAEHSRRWQRKFLAYLQQNFTHVFIEASIPILGGMHRSNLRKQIDTLRDAGLQVAMICHGNDVRLPSRHCDLEQWSQFREGVWEPVSVLEPVVQEHLDVIHDMQLPCFVATAGLLLDLPTAHFLGVVVDTQIWDQAKPLRESFHYARPRVVHAPTNPRLKGTDIIAPVLRKLDEQGVIEYRELQGVAHDQVPAEFSTADIVVDQFRVGDYGVAACEAMASGRIVIGHVSAQVREYVESRSHLSLPIYEANLDDFEQVLRSVVEDPRSAIELAESGPEFVNTLHNGTFSSEVLNSYITRTSA